MNTEQPNISSPINNKSESPYMFNRIARTYDLLNRMLSFGIDIYWRNVLKSKLPNTPQKLEVLDLATGTADLTMSLAKDPKVMHVTGIDPSEGMLKVGKEKKSRSSLDSKITLQLADALALPFSDNRYDVVSVSFGVRNFPDPEKGLKEAYRVLRPGGKILILEFGVPKGILKYLYLFYFRQVLPFIGSLVSRDKKAYRYLNQTVEEFPFAGDFTQILKNANFEKTTFKSLTFGICYLYEGTKK